MSDSPTLPRRHLNLAGASNFRDLGGYPAAGGRLVRWRQIFRSNHLGNLTDDDIEKLGQLGLKSAFDFRGTQERSSAICRHEGITVHSLAIEPMIVDVLRQRLALSAEISEDETREIMKGSYRNYVRKNSDAFRSLFQHLLGDHAPLVIHCTAGKDRTGFASALILRALGVDAAVVLEDYLLTNQFYKVDIDRLNWDLPASAGVVLMRVEADFLHASFEAIEADYGDLATYFEARLGIGQRELAALRARYLEV